MKLLVAAIFKICASTNGLFDDEAMLTCFDKYVNCSIDMKNNTEVKALKQLKKCQGIK